MSAGRNVSPIGVHGNAWNAATVGSNGTSAVLDTWSCPYVSAFGNGLVWVQIWGRYVAEQARNTLKRGTREAT